MKSLSRLVACVCLVVGMGVVSAQVAPPLKVDNPIDQPPRYTIQDFDPIERTSVASALNARGQVVGRYTFSGQQHAFIFDAVGGVRDLGTLGGHFSTATDINDAGVVVGYSLTGDTDDFGFVNAPFVVDDAGMRGLGAAFDGGVAYGITAQGWIVGERRPILGNRLRQAFLFRDGVTIDLGSLLQSDDTRTGVSTARAVNRAGQIVGDSATFVLAGVLNPPRRMAVSHAFLYDGGELIDLGSFGVFCVPLPTGGERCTDSSSATDINEQGQVVGFSWSEAGTRAFVTNEDQTLRNLGTLGGNQSWAYGINDSGQIVGGSLNEMDHYKPFVVDRGTMYNLQDLLVEPSADLPFAAYAINNFGHIAGNHHLLTPVYQTLTPGARISFRTELGSRLSFEWWTSRRNASVCRVNRNNVRVQVRLGEDGQWTNVSDIRRECGDSTEWSAASFAIPARRRGTSAQLFVRVLEAGGTTTSPLVYVRHFSME